MCSLAQIEANQRNAQKSTGPRTEEGKKRSSHNSLKHGLTAKSIALEPGDEESFKDFADRITKEFAPRTDYEMSLVDEIVSATWRLRMPIQIEAAQLRVLKHQAGKSFGESLLQSDIVKSLNAISTYQTKIERGRARAVQELLQHRNRNLQTEDETPPIEWQPEPIYDEETIVAAFQWVAEESQELGVLIQYRKAAQDLAKAADELAEEHDKIVSRMIPDAENLSGTDARRASVKKSEGHLWHVALKASELVKKIEHLQSLEVNLSKPLPQGTDTPFREKLLKDLQASDEPNRELESALHNLRLMMATPDRIQTILHESNPDGKEPGTTSKTESKKLENEPNSKAKSPSNPAVARLNSPNAGHREQQCPKPPQTLQKNHERSEPNSIESVVNDRHFGLSQNPSLTHSLVTPSNESAALERLQDQNLSPAEAPAPNLSPNTANLPDQNLSLAESLSPHLSVSAKPTPEGVHLNSPGSRFPSETPGKGAQRSEHPGGMPDSRTNQDLPEYHEAASAREKSGTCEPIHTSTAECAIRRQSTPPAQALSNSQPPNACVRNEEGEGGSEDDSMSNLIEERAQKLASLTAEQRRIIERLRIYQRRLHNAQKNLKGQEKMNETAFCQRWIRNIELQERFYHTIPPEIRNFDPNCDQQVAPMPDGYHNTSACP